MLLCAFLNVSRQIKEIPRRFPELELLLSKCTKVGIKCNQYGFIPTNKAMRLYLNLKTIDAHLTKLISPWTAQFPAKTF